MKINAMRKRNIWQWSTMIRCLSDFCLAEMQMENAKCALSAGIKFLEVKTKRTKMFLEIIVSTFVFQLLSDKNQSNRFHLKLHQPDLYMRLDKAAMIALNIFPDQRQRPDFSLSSNFDEQKKIIVLICFSALGGNAKSSSVYGLLNHCRTSQGQRLLMQWLKQPLTDVAKISSFVFTRFFNNSNSFTFLDERLDIVDILVNETTIRNYITQDFLGRVPDFERLVRKFIRKKANLEVKFSDVLELSESLWKFIFTSFAIDIFSWVQTLFFKLVALNWFQRKFCVCVNRIDYLLSICD